MSDIRANSVEIAKLNQAQCRLPQCGWKGPLRDSYAEANADRGEHLADHKAGKL